MRAGAEFQMSQEDQSLAKGWTWEQHMERLLPAEAFPIQIGAGVKFFVRDIPGSVWNFEPTRRR